MMSTDTSTSTQGWWSAFYLCCTILVHIVMRVKSKKPSPAFPWYLDCNISVLSPHSGRTDLLCFQTKHGDTPLSCAISQRSLEIVQLLVDTGRCHCQIRVPATHAVRLHVYTNRGQHQNIKSVSVTTDTIHKNIHPKHRLSLLCIYCVCYHIHSNDSLHPKCLRSHKNQWWMSWSFKKGLGQRWEYKTLNHTQWCHNQRLCGKPMID